MAGGHFTDRTRGAEGYFGAKLKRSRQGDVVVEEMATFCLLHSPTFFYIVPKSMEGDKVKVNVVEEQKLLEDVTENTLVLKADWPAVSKKQPPAVETTEVLFTHIMNDRSYEFFESILHEILKEDVTEEVIRTLYEKFRLRLLGFTKGLEVLMEVEADLVADMLTKAAEIQRELSQLLPEVEREHVMWSPFSNIPVRSEDDREQASTSVGVDDDSTETVNRALSYACQYGNYRTCLKLMKHRNADVTVLGRNGKTPFHIACQYGQSHILDLLLEKGAQVNQPDREGLGPLHLACDPRPAGTGTDIEEGKRQSTVQWLLQHGVDVHLKTPDGMTAEDLAKMGGYQNIVQLLQSYSG